MLPINSLILVFNAKLCLKWDVVARSEVEVVDRKKVEHARRGDETNGERERIRNRRAGWK